MNLESKHDLKEKIRLRYKGGDTENMHMIPARPKESLFEENTDKRVCAYCRVSTDDPRQTSSYELQKNHYEGFIKEHPGWVLVDIYADEGITGTSLDKRDEFNRMIADCQRGRIGSGPRRHLVAQAAGLQHPVLSKARGARFH